MYRSLVLFFGILIAASAHAHPEDVGNIRGDQIQLRTVNHGFSGSIKNRLVLGYKKSGEFVSQLRIIEKDHETVSVFQSIGEDGFGGYLNLQIDGKLKNIPIRFKGFVKEENRYVMTFAGKEISVNVVADAFENGHFINPEYAMEYEGKFYSFKMEGQACHGYSLHLITMIMSVVIF